MIPAIQVFYHHGLSELALFLFLVQFIYFKYSFVKIKA